MKILITGSNGFIGSHLVERLLDQGHQVLCLVRKTSRLTWLENLPVELKYGDVADFDSLVDIVPGTDYIYHLGGVLRTSKKSEFYRINYQGTRNLLEACRVQHLKLQRFVYISSQAAAGPGRDGTPVTEKDTPKPISNYGKSKRLAEQAVLKYQQYFPITIIRPPAVYGPRDDDVLAFFKYIKFRIKPLLGARERMVSVIYVHDLVRGIKLAAEHPAGKNEIFFMANKEHYSWLQIEDTIARVMDRKAITVRFPEFVLDLMAIFGEQVAHISKNANLINRDKAIELKQNCWLIDPSKAEQKLGFVAEVPLETGLRETYHWYREQGWL